MKGFAITPVLFIGAFLIAGLMLLTFIDSDTQIVKGILHESEISNLFELYMENKTSTSNLLFQYAVTLSPNASSKQDLEAELKSLTGCNVSITCHYDYFTLKADCNFYKKLGDSEINRDFTISKNITCEAINDITKKNATIC